MSSHYPTTGNLLYNVAPSHRVPEHQLRSIYDVTGPEVRPLHGLLIRKEPECSSILSASQHQLLDSLSEWIPQTLALLTANPRFSAVGLGKYQDLTMHC